MSTVPRLVARRLAIFLAVVGSPALAACSIAQPPGIAASLARPQAIGAVTIVPAEEAQAGRAAFAQALASAFEKRGIAVGEDAGFIVDLSIAAAGGEVLLALDQGGGKDAAVLTLANPTNSSLFDRCAKERVRASIAVFARDSGSLVGKSDAQAIQCRGDAMPLEALAELLLDDVLAPPPVSG